ncbi:MAG: hypothetical protein ACK5K7_04765 [Bacilli bacterium]
MNEKVSGKRVVILGCKDKACFSGVFCEATELIRDKVEELGGIVTCENIKID